MAPCTKENGEMICNMGEALKLGLISLNMKGITNSEGNMVLAIISGMMVVSTLEIGMKTK